METLEQVAQDLLGPTIIWGGIVLAVWASVKGINMRRRDVAKIEKGFRVYS